METGIREVKKRKAVSRGCTRQTGSSPASADDVSTRRYIESISLVAAVPKGDTAAKASNRAKEQRVKSALTMAEAGRAVFRASS